MEIEENQVWMGTAGVRRRASFRQQTQEWRGRHVLWEREGASVETRAGPA